MPDSPGYNYVVVQPFADHAIGDTLTTEPKDNLGCVVRVAAPTAPATSGSEATEPTAPVSAGGTVTSGSGS